MSFDTGLSVASAQMGVLDAQAERVLQRGRAAAEAGGTPSKEDAKIQKAGTDFESILLGSWLQKAESTFASVPGGDEDEDADSGKDQFQGIAMQALAGSLTASGGIGIAKMITDSLRASSGAQGGGAGGGNTPHQPGTASPVLGKFGE
jgi:Rod binding domain-containing protein